MRNSSWPIHSCPGFGQNRVNFHWTPGRGTAGGWGLTPPGQTEPDIPYHVTSRWVPVGGAAQQIETHGLGGRGAGAVRESGCLGRVVRCCVFSLFVPLLLLFPSVCCSVKLPLSRPTSFCLFLFILLPTLAGGSRNPDSR